MKHTAITHSNIPYNRTSCSNIISYDRYVKAKQGEKAHKKRPCFHSLIFFGIILAMFLTIGAMIRQSPAEASTISSNNVYYKSIEVSEGDTLWTIADEYMGNAFTDKESYIREVKKLNHLNNDQIQTGAYLMIPYVGEN